MPKEWLVPNLEDKRRILGTLDQRSDPTAVVCACYCDCVCKGVCTSVCTPVVCACACDCEDED